MALSPEAITVLGATLFAAAVGCGGSPPCASSTACPDGSVCQPDGTCAPLDARGSRFRRAAWLSAIDWATTRDDHLASPVPDTDVLAIGGGGDAVVHLTFEALPDDRRITGAIVRVFAHEGWSGPDARIVLALQRTTEFEGATLTRRRAPPAMGAPIAEAAVAPGPPRAVAFDVTEAVQQMLRGRERRLSVAIRRATGDDGVPLRIVSPRADDRDLRPRLELRVR